MRIRRTIIAPLILTIGAIGSLVAAPAVAAMTSVAPAATRWQPAATRTSTTRDLARPVSGPPSITQSTAGRCFALSPLPSSHLVDCYRFLVTGAIRKRVRRHDWITGGRYRLIYWFRQFFP